MPGASVGVFPEIINRKVLRLLQVLRVDPSSRVRIAAAATANKAATTHRDDDDDDDDDDAVVELHVVDLFSRYLDVAARPARFLLSLLSVFVKDHNVKHKLRHLASRTLVRKTLLASSFAAAAAAAADDDDDDVLPMNRR